MDVFPALLRHVNLSPFQNSVRFVFFLIKEKNRTTFLDRKRM